MESARETETKTEAHSNLTLLGEQADKALYEQQQSAYKTAGAEQNETILNKKRKRNDAVSAAFT